MSTVLTGQETVAATGRAAAVPQPGRRRRTQQEMA